MGSTQSTAADKGESGRGLGLGEIGDAVDRWFDVSTDYVCGQTSCSCLLDDGADGSFTVGQASITVVSADGSTDTFGPEPDAARASAAAFDDDAYGEEYRTLVLGEPAPGAAVAVFFLELNLSTAPAWRSITVVSVFNRAAYRDHGKAPAKQPTHFAASLWTASLLASDSGCNANGKSILALSSSFTDVIHAAAFAKARARRWAWRCATFSKTSMSLLLASRNCCSAAKRGK